MTNRAQQYTVSAVQVHSALQALQPVSSATAGLTSLIEHAFMHSFGIGHEVDAHARG